MALSNWGAHVVGMALESDEEEKESPAAQRKQTTGPLPPSLSHLYEPTSPSRPKTISVPLSASACNPVKALLPDRALTEATSKASPYIVTSPTSHSWPASVTSSATLPSGSLHDNGNSNYVQVFSGIKGGRNGLDMGQQAEKRRKLSVHAMQTSGHTHSRNVSASFSGECIVSRQPPTNDGCRVHRASGSPTQPQGFLDTTHDWRASEKLNSNKMPSMHSLNAMMKSSGARIPFIDDMPAGQPRALHFGSIPSGQDEEDATRTVDPESTISVGPRLPASTVAPAERRWNTFNEELADGEDEVVALEDFRPRISPPKKYRVFAQSEIAHRVQTPQVPPQSPPSIEEQNARLFVFSGPISSPRHKDQDSLFSDASDHRVDPPPSMNNTKEITGVNHNATVRPQIQRHWSFKSLTNSRFSEEDVHLLIFLKEVKKLKWKDIEKHFPGLKWSQLQAHYSSVVNKRDRTQDPPRLKLPEAYQYSTSREGPSTFDHSYSNYSSGADSPLRRERPRRAVPVQNYTWPKRNRLKRTIEDDADTEATEYEGTASIGNLGRSEEPSEEPRVIPEKAIKVDSDPMDLDYDKEDSVFAIAAQRRGIEYARQKLPYLSSLQRCMIQNSPDEWEWQQVCGRDWQGSVVHVDFSPAEMDIVEHAITTLLKSSRESRSRNQRRYLRTLLKTLTEPKLLQLSYEIRRHLYSRDRKSIGAFLEDAKNGNFHSIPRIERMGPARPFKNFSSTPKTSVLSQLRQRELGLQSRRGWKAATKPLTYQLMNKIQDSLGPAISYTGASSDVHTVAWSPDGRYFAAGAICVVDEHSQQYNRPNNLLYGDVAHKVIYELGEHSKPRGIPGSGPNSTYAMYASQDPMLYTTVSSVAFSPSGRVMYSGGHDEHVCMWDITNGGSQPELVSAMLHKAAIDIMSVNCNGILATAAKRHTMKAVKVITSDEDTASNFDIHSFHSSKASLRHDLNILPTALQFEPRDGRLLLAGFGANVREDGRDTNGDICLWDVRTLQPLNVHGSNWNVLDLAWSQTMPWFAVGCVARQNVNRGTRSVVRLYDGHGTDKYSLIMELECKALDMNDVVFCPNDPYLIAAGCTSGRAYVWDIRRHDHLLRELAHASSVMPLDDDIDREITDTGVRFLSWGDNATRLYSGSSDGIVKVWDVTRSEEETFIKDLITTDSGIMSGAFSPDKSKLIVGEVNGSINVLEVGRDDCSSKDAEQFKYIPYKEGHQPGDDQHHIPRSGIAEAAQLLATGQMLNVPMGGLPIRQAVQGPNYNGPYDESMDAAILREQAQSFQCNLASIPSQQCNLLDCRDSIIKVTSEEVGDSGRSTDRIPDELRQQWKAICSPKIVLPRKLKCLNCSRPARPPDSSKSDVNIPALCERCSFECFRCGEINAIPPVTEKLVCIGCERIWNIGALGYECVKESKSCVQGSDVPWLKGYARDLYWSRMHNEDDASFGDTMNALTDYYHSLAMDRPESPPL